MSSLGRILIATGVLLALVGVVLVLFDRIPWFGRLPGDIAIRKGSFSFYFPLTTCIVLSLLLSLLVYLLRK